MTSSDPQEGSVVSEVERFVCDAVGFFESSYAKTHSIAHDRLQELQRSGLAYRFDEQRERTPMVAKLAGRQGIERLQDFPDVLPLLFDHTMYKSYPVALLEQQQFGTLTRWLDKLTAVDLGNVDVSGCDSIDSWLHALFVQSSLDPSHSGGTSGTMSFLPWSREDREKKAQVNRVNRLQAASGVASAAALEEPFHYIGSTPRSHVDYECDAITLGIEGYAHPRTQRSSVDLLWLGSRLALAAARGDVTRVEVPASLLARRDELERMRAEEARSVASWVDVAKRMQGERVMWSMYPAHLYEVTAPRVEAGERWSYHPDSIVMVPGGTRGAKLPADWWDVGRRFVDAPMLLAYSMQEVLTILMECSAGRYHLHPSIIPYVLDPDTSEMLPRAGRQTGRFAFFDLMVDSHWGGFISGDEVEVEFDGHCDCGWTTPSIGPKIERFIDKTGGDDKITCAATPQAYDEAMRFLTSL